MRLHPLLSTALCILHFRSFPTQNDSLPDAFLEELRHLNEERSPEVLEAFEKSTVFHEVMETYERYTAETRLGDHGSTAQFWITYIDLVELYLLFSRACHTNDLDLFIYCLGKMCYLFFAASRHNYGKWMVRYHLDLLNVETTHPGVSRMLKAGGLSVRR